VVLLDPYRRMRAWSRAIASLTQPGGGDENNLGGAKYLSSFLKFEVKNRHKSAEEAKSYILLFVTSVLFSNLIK